MTNFIPAGHHSVAPFFLVRDAAKLIDFLQQALEAKELSRLTKPDGTVMNAQLKIGDSIVMIGERGGAFPEVLNSVHLYVQNVDESYARCLSLGATSISEPKSFFYGDRSAGIKDPAGNIWWLGTHEEDVSPGEAQNRLNAMVKKQG